MRMIPDSPYGTNSSAEKRVFDKLRTVRFDQGDEQWTAFHSLGLTRHEGKRFGEIDFLLLGPKGLFVLEVKGGRVAFREQGWIYIDRNDVEHLSQEGPFRQAESALHGLVKRLRESLPASVINQISIGYGVVFPDCEWQTQGAEWDPRTLADAGKFREFKRWLLGLIEYWRSKDGGGRHASPDALKALKQFLRPEFETALPLHVQAHEAEEAIERLTEDQMFLVDVVSANHSVLCSGGAGTGKTFLALELARRWAGEGKSVLLACHSPWLRAYLSSRFDLPGVVVAQVGKILTAMRRQGLSAFDALIIDEGQDLLDLDSLDQLDSVLVGGFAEGRWCFFHDVNNQSGFFNIPAPEALEYLQSFKPANVPLSTNCRNTKVILEKVQTSLGVDMGTRGAGIGPQVRESVADTNESAGRLLENEVNSILNEGGLSPGLLILLSPFEFEDSSASLLSDKLKRSICQLDEYSLKSFPLRDTAFATVGQFKGLENDAVILIDVPQTYSEHKDLAMKYVGMSRARSVLSIIYRSDLDPT